MNMRFYPFLLSLLLLLSSSPAMAKEVYNLSAETSDWKEWGAPFLLVDDDVTTAWVAGGKGVGPGKRLTIQLPKATKINRIRIANGYQGDGKFNEFRCITSGVLRLPDRATHYFTLKPERGEQDIVFPPMTVKSFDILISEVAPYSGTILGNRKVAVSEIRVFTDDGGATSTSVVNAPPPAPKNKTKAAPKISVPKPDKMPFFSAIKPALGWLKGAVPVPAGEELAPGHINLELPASHINRIRKYFTRVVTLNDSILDVFSDDVRDREMGAMAYLRGDMKRLGRLEQLQAASVNPNGLALGKPVIRGKAGMVPVHGTIRYTSGGKSYQFPVNARFSFIKYKGTWLINGVQKL